MDFIHGFTTELSFSCMPEKNQVRTVTGEGTKGGHFFFFFFFSQLLWHGFICGEYYFRYQIPNTNP
jgi:hypothetical protein